jgi:hypothetical protein
MVTGREKAPTTAPMTLNRATRLARHHSHLSTFGVQYVLRTWSLEHDAWRDSVAMDLHRAKTALREMRIRFALVVLGVNDAKQIAHDASHDPGRWTEVVRLALEADRTVRTMTDASKAEAKAWGRS